MLAHGHFLEPSAAGHGQADVALGVHNVHGAEGPAVGLQGFPVPFRSLARAFVKHVALHNGTVGNGSLEPLHPGAGQNVRPVGFAGVQFEGDLAGHAFIDLGVDVQQALGAQIPGEKNLGLGRRRGQSRAALQGKAHGQRSRGQRPVFQKIAS